MGRQLIITKDILSKIICDLWEDGGTKYYFDFDDYMIKAEDEIAEGAYVIPLVHVTQAAVMKAFINDQNDRRLSRVFKDLSDKELWGRFWSYFDDDGILSSRWGRYEEDYRLRLIRDWCKDNGISFRQEDI